MEMTEPTPNTELDKAIGVALVYLERALKDPVTYDGTKKAVSMVALWTLRDATNRLKELEKENAFFRRLLNPLKDCPQCRGGGWITLSEDGGVPAPCDCWSASKIKLDKELSRLRIDYKNALEALNTAIGTVECASIDLNTQEELPWYKQAKAILSTPSAIAAMNGKP